MRQGLFPICIVCAVTAASSRKNFDKPSIATEKSFCNSKGVHSSGKQCLRIYKDHFALQNACWEIPNPWTASDGCRLRVFAKRSFSTPQECAAITERDDYRIWGSPTSEQTYIRLHCWRKPHGNFLFALQTGWRFCIIGSMNTRIKSEGLSD